jgi:T5SS/PEP-CTERM-associated repeat protein
MRKIPPRRVARLPGEILTFLWREDYQVISKLKFISTAGLVACLATLTPPAGAATKQWDSTSGNWNVSGNWSPTGLPTGSDEVKIRYANNSCFIPNGYTATAYRMYVYSEGTGSLVVNGTLAISTTWLKVGFDGGVGRLYQTGNVLMDDGADLIVGDGGTARSATAIGNYYLQGGSLNTDSLRLGDRGGVGYLYHSGGTACYNRMYVGYDGTGTYQMTGGTVHNAGTLYVGHANLTGTASMGTFTHSAGTITQGGSIYIGRNADGTGTYSLSGSGLMLAAGQTLYVGSSGTGTLDQSGGSMVIGTVNIAANSGSKGVLNLSGGTLQATTVSKGSGTATFNFTGGTLKTDNVAFAFTNSGGVFDVGATGVNNAATVGGNLTLSFGSVKMELASLSSYDKLAVTGSISLGGALDLSLTGGYTPNIGDSWTVMTSTAGVTGVFASITTGYAVTIANGGYDLLLTYVPEPSVVLLLTMGAVMRLGLGRGRKSRKVRILPAPDPEPQQAPKALAA